MVWKNITHKWVKENEDILLDYYVSYYTQVKKSDIKEIYLFFKNKNKRIIFKAVDNVNFICLSNTDEYHNIDSIRIENFNKYLRDIKIDILLI